MSFEEPKLLDESRQGEVLIKETTPKNPDAKKLYLESYGCAMNFSDSEIVASIMTDKGFTITNAAEDADVIFLNTCAIRDNAEARILINKSCGQLQKPLVYAVVKDWEGYVTVLHHTKKVSLEHIFSNASLLDNAALNCSLAGIVNTTCGIAGSIQAAEVFKIVLGMPSELDGSILCFNSLLPSFREFRLIVQ